MVGASISIFTISPSSQVDIFRPQELVEKELPFSNRNKVLTFFVEPFELLKWLSDHVRLWSHSSLMNQTHTIRKWTDFLKASFVPENMTVSANG